MKIPNDKLPLRITLPNSAAIYGQYRIGCINPKDGSYKHAGLIAYKDLSQYVVKSTNNFEEAIEILKNIKLDAKMALDDRWDRSDDGFITQIEIIEEFLNSLEDEES